MTETTTLFEAIKTNKLDEVVKALEADSRTLNQPNERGEAPLHIAVQGKNVKIVEKLIEAGANVNFPTEGGGSMKGYTAAHYAARNGDVDMILMLAKHKVDLNAGAADGWCPIHCAAFSGKRNAINAMLDRGADVNAPTTHGLTALAFASNHGRLQDVKDLASRGGKLDVVDANGDTLMHSALHHQMFKLFEGEYDMPEVQYDIIVRLALLGCPVDKKNNSGELATEFATPSVCDFLRCLSHARETFNKSTTDWNYATIVAARVENFLGIGLPMKQAVDLYELGQKVEKERLAEKKRKAEEMPKGGCPIIRSKKNKAPEIPKDGSDPSNGACPFFQKKDGESAPADHPPVGDIPKDGSDPSGGQCPFFQKKDGAASAPAPQLSAHHVAAAHHNAAASSTAVESPMKAGYAQRDNGQAPPLNWQTIYENRTVILLMFISFFLGMLVEQRLPTRV